MQCLTKERWTHLWGQIRVKGHLDPSWQAWFEG
jgi:hypothetical protein